MQCRPHCGACCVVLSISAPIPEMPNGKAAGERCVHLSVDDQCRLFHLASRPNVCTRLKPSLDICGDNKQQAYELIKAMELFTAPSEGKC